MPLFFWLVWDSCFALLDANSLKLFVRLVGLFFAEFACQSYQQSVNISGLQYMKSLEILTPCVVAAVPPLGFVTVSLPYLC